MDAANGYFRKLEGNKEGPTSVILAGVHGDERGGIEALQRLLPTLQIERGRVFVGYGNPRAVEQNKRLTETNLNRMFKPDSMLSEEEKMSYEYARAQLVKKYLDQADALLDLHSSFVEGSQPFIICEASARGIVEYLPAHIVVSGFDRVQPGGTDYYMNKRGGAGVCVECGYLADTESVKVATESVFSFLRSRGHINGDIKKTEKSFFSIYEMYMTKTDKFVRSKDFADFDEIHKDQLVGIDGNEEVVSKKQSIILFARDCMKSGEEAFLLAAK